MSKSFAIKLSSRGVVRITGSDSLRYLQGLVTNDVHRICGPEAPSTCSGAFLNGRGRVLFGTLLHRYEDNHYLIDIEANQIQSLIKHLKQYRLRAKVDIEDASNEFSIWSYVGDHNPPDQVFFRDPRGLLELGFRAITNPDYKPDQKILIEDEHVYTRLRIEQGVADNGDFHNTPLPLDLGLHLLGGISFSKGCYLGQELTARSHFTGVLRKRITPIQVSDGFELKSGMEIYTDSTIQKKAIGKISSAANEYGLAILKLSEAFDKSGNGMELYLKDGTAVNPKRPHWWPTEEWQQSSKSGEEMN